jgi:hypothetical protein
MIWTCKAKRHWVCCSIEGVEAEVKIIKDLSHWCLINLETGEILYSGKANNPLDAMKMVRYFNGVGNESTY